MSKTLHSKEALTGPLAEIAKLIQQKRLKEIAFDNIKDKYDTLSPNSPAKTDLLHLGTQKTLRWKAHVQIRKGDQFIDWKWIRMIQLKNEIKILEPKPGKGKRGG